MQQQPAYAAHLMHNDPKMAEMLATNREFILEDGALSAKVKTLMTMLCDALLAHENGVSVIADRARDMGATEAEIAETIRVAFLMGGLPALVTGVNAFKKEQLRYNPIPPDPLDTRLFPHCLCGCGSPNSTYPAGTMFNHGHDAKLRSQLNKIARNDLPRESIPIELIAGAENHPEWFVRSGRRFLGKYSADDILALRDAAE